VIDYGMGNIGSVVNMIKKVGYTCIVSSNKNDILNATKLILPGVGSFDEAIKNLQDLDIIESINNQVLQNNIPILGICLGMQLLTNGSDEGKIPGLGYIDAYARKLNLNEDVIIPHMGWNLLDIKKDNLLFDEELLEQRFYFVHSFFIECQDNIDILSKTSYGVKFVSSFQKNNIIGVQFHPEKSHKFGKNFFKNFLEKM